jgi:flagella basal body P-ring formation protein FlgA
MKIITKILFAIPVLLAQATVWAQTPAPRQDKDAIRQLVEQFLVTQTTGLPGQVTVKVGAIDPRLNLAACAAPEPSLPSGSRPWGKTTVVIRCTTPAAWTLYVSAYVQIHGDYITTAVPLAQGQVVASTDVVKMTGDLSTLPPGILTDPAQAIGRTIANSLKAGTPLRRDSLRAQQAVQQGQTVHVVSGGAGYKVSTEAQALTNASEGQMAQARTANGQVLSGVAKMGGVLEINY